MKLGQLILLLLSWVMACIAVLASLITPATPEAYKQLLMTAVICGLISIGCMVYLTYSGSRWFYIAIISSVLSMCAMTDFLLRSFLQLRLLDLF